MRNLLPPNGRGQGQLTHFQFWGSNHILGMGEGSHFKIRV